MNLVANKDKTMNEQTILFGYEPYQGIDRTDNPAYPIFASIYKGMQKRFWIPESTPMGADYQRFKDLPKDVQDIYDYMHRLGDLKKGQRVAIKIKLGEDTLELIVNL